MLNWLKRILEIHSPSTFANDAYKVYKRENVCPNCTDVLYLCDEQACDPCHNDYCQHTMDIRHAKNFKRYENSHGAYYMEANDD